MHQVRRFEVGLFHSSSKNLACFVPSIILGIQTCVHEFWIQLIYPLGAWDSHKWNKDEKVMVQRQIYIWVAVEKHCSLWKKSRRGWEVWWKRWNSNCDFEDRWTQKRQKSRVWETPRTEEWLKTHKTESPGNFRSFSKAMEQRMMGKPGEGQGWL